MAIHLFHDDGDYEIWSNPEPGKSKYGRCIGVGPTLDLAKLDAIDELNGDIAAVEALTEDGDAEEA